MKTLLIALLFFSSSAFANCNVHVPVTTWNYYGYPIELTVAIRDLLEQKNYHQVDTLEQANFLLTLNVESKDTGYFQKATTEYLWTSRESNLVMQKEYAKLCITNLCAIYDFIKPVEKLMKGLTQDLPACTN